MYTQSFVFTFQNYIRSTIIKKFPPNSLFPILSILGKIWLKLRPSFRLISPVHLHLLHAILRLVLSQRLCQGRHQRLPDLGRHWFAISRHEKTSGFLKDQFADFLTVVVHDVLDVDLVLLVPRESGQHGDVVAGRRPIWAEEEVRIPGKKNILFLKGTHF